MKTWIWVLSLFSSVAYGYIIIKLYADYRKLYRTIKFNETHTTRNSPQTKFSIIIAVRNEADNLLSCLQALSALQYPTHLFEIIFIDDHSSDLTVQILEKAISNFSNMKILHAKNFSSESVAKKRALEYGINQATYSWIICTDGDSQVPPQWLYCVDNYLQKHDVLMVAAPCELMNSKGFWQEFQQADYLSLQGITAAVVSSKKCALANGANLAYYKPAFMEMNGFLGYEKIATGDDMLLMQKMHQKFGWEKIGYLLHHNAIVRTNGAKNLSEFMQQRIRWGSKFKQVEKGWLKIIMVVSYLFHLVMISVGVGSFFYSDFLIGFLVMFISSAMIEFLFMTAITSFFKKRFLLKYFVVFKCVYAFYYLVLGGLAMFKTYHWKDRIITPNVPE